LQRTEIQRRAITCYECGLNLGTIEVGMDFAGMAAYREESKRRRQEHKCGQGEPPRLGNPSRKTVDEALRPPL